MSQSRRSARLVSGGYYQSDDDSDSSVSTNISYRESPVKVFKKKTGARKTTSRASSRANSTASTASSQAGTHTPAAQNTGGVPLLRASLKTQSTRFIHSTTIPTTTSTTFNPGPDSSSGPAPAPAPAPNRTPVLGLFPPPSVRPLGGLDGPSQTGGHVRLGQAQSGIDSSGYSSAEGHHRRSTSVTKTSGSANSSCKSVTWRGRARSAAAAAQTKIMNTFNILSSVSLTPSTRKALLLFLLLFLMALSIWYLFPMFTLLLPLLTTSKTTSTSSQREIPSSAPPVFSSPSPPPLLLPSSSAPPLPVSSPPHPPSPPIAMVSWQMESVAMETRMEKKMQSLLEDLMAKQETLYLQMKETVRLDLRSLRAEVTGLDGEARARLEKHISGLSQQLTGLQTHSRTDTATLQQRVDALERHRVEMDKELLSIQNSPPPAPCPDTPTTPTEPHQNQLTPDLQRALEEWLSERLKQEQDKQGVSGQDACKDCARPLADKMADFALESQGASVVSTRCSETYVTRSACVTLFGFPLWYPSESPRTVIQGHSVMLPGKCWAFHGVQGALVLSLSHPISITHVTLDHLPRCLSPTGHIQSAPRDFQVHGMETDAETGTLLGKYTYDQDGESTQTFEILNPKDTVYRFVELRVLSNWGQVDYTCVYRFRVHGKIASS